MNKQPGRYLGRIVQLQIQRSSLKQGEKPYRYYDPAPLLQVAELELSPGGTYASTGDGTRLIDVHNVAHPDSRNHDNINSCSIGFSAHYGQMRRQFGTHLVDGIAGENILIGSERQVTLDDIAGGIIIRHASDGSLISLEVTQVAHPCVEFSHYALGRKRGEASNLEIKQTLQILDGGIRGFYCRLSEPQTATIAVGDEVYTPGGV